MNLLGADEVSAITKYDVRTIRRFFDDGAIPRAFKLKGQWRIDEEDLKRWVDSQRLNPDKFIELELEKFRKTEEYINSDEDLKPVIEYAHGKNLLKEYYNMKDTTPPVPAINGIPVILGSIEYSFDGHVKSVDGMPWPEFIARTKKAKTNELKDNEGGDKR